MEHGEIVFRTVELIFGAAAAFFAILLASKKRCASVVLLAAHVLLAYARMVHSLLCDLGVVARNTAAFGADALSFAFCTVSSLALILSLVFFVRDSK